jgi:hypothetical protein
LVPLKLPRELTKAGSKHKLDWTEDEAAFEKVKEALVADLQLYHINPNKPFALKTDASDYAIDAALEQFPNIDGVPQLDEIKPGASVAVSFISRKLTGGQRTKWDKRDKGTYAVVSALEKWAPYIGYNPVLVLGDHKSLESWYKEHVSGLGPSGRRARWHNKMGKFNINVVHIPGVDNVVGDVLSRWAYPACTGLEDVSWHGNAQETDEMEEMLRAGLPRCDYLRRWSAISASQSDLPCCSLHVSEPREPCDSLSKLRGLMSRRETSTQPWASCHRVPLPHWCQDLLQLCQGPGKEKIARLFA